MTSADHVFNSALTMRPNEKIQLIEQLISSLDRSDKELDQLWSEEAESRISAYEQGKIKSVSIDKILQKYK